MRSFEPSTPMTLHVADAAEREVLKIKVHVDRHTTFRAEVIP